MSNLQQDTGYTSAMDEKAPPTTTAVEVGPGLGGEALIEEQHTVMSATKSTDADVYNMHRMGKKQEFVRRFKVLSTVSFVALATAAWELGIFLITPGLVDGGIPGLIYSLIWSFVGFFPIYLSMAEMSSMAPIAGAQYHWVSEFAPDSCQKILSYLTGWTSTIAWQAGNALGVFLTGTLIQTTIQVAKPDYSYPNWQGTLLVIATIVFVYIGNVYGSKILPYWQTSLFIIHILAFFGFCIPIWINAPKISVEKAATEFSNTGGWSSMALAVLAGQLSGVSSQCGIDTAAHMSEDVANAGASIPVVMMTVYFVNFFLIIVAIVTACFGMTDLGKALADPTAYPVIWVMRQAMSNTWIIVLLVITNVLLMAGNISYFAAVTRDLFAFARDRGLPFSAWISKVHQKRLIPENGARLSSVIGILLSLIYIGSPVAVYAITSLCTVALLQCYITSIGCVLWRRIYHPETLPPSHFSLGRWGIAVNSCAVAFGTWGFFWCFWPVTVNPSAGDFNWASPIYVAVLLIAMVYYVIWARHTYTGPVVEVLGRGR